MIKAIIFDLDGLLIDSEIIWYQLYQDLIRPYGYGFSIEDYAEHYSGKTAERVHGYDGWDLFLPDGCDCVSGETGKGAELRFMHGVSRYRFKFAGDDRMKHRRSGCLTIAVVLLALIAVLVGEAVCGT